MEKSLERVVKLAQEQAELESKKNDLEKQLKETNKKITGIAGGYGVEGQLPALMQELELKDFTLEDGKKIIIDDELKAPSMAASSKHRATVVQWLKDNGYGDIIKSEIKAMFSQNDERKAKAAEALKEIGVPFEDYETVHSQTLTALFNELLGQGKDLPMEELSIQVWRQAVVK